MQLEGAVARFVRRRSAWGLCHVRHQHWNPSRPSRQIHTSPSSHLRPSAAATTLHLPWFLSPDFFRCPRRRFIHGEIFCLFYLFFLVCSRVLNHLGVYYCVSFFYIFMCCNYRESTVYTICIVAKINLCSLHGCAPFIFVIWFLDLNQRTWYASIAGAGSFSSFCFMWQRSIQYRGSVL